MKTINDIVSSFPSRRKAALFHKTDFRTFRWSYARLHQCIRKFACLLEERGVKQHNRVLLWAPNMPEWLVASLGTIYYGAVIVPADLQATTETVEAIAKDARPALIIKTKYRPALGCKAPSVFIEELEVLLNGKREWQARHVPRYDDIIELVYTSGTTGSPKGVMLTHRNIVSNVEAMTRHVRISSNDHFLSMLPLSHIFEQVPGMLVPLSRGATITYLSSLKASAIFDALSPRTVTVIMAVPRLLQSITRSIRKRAGSSVIGRIMPMLMKAVLRRSLHRTFGRQFRFFVSGGAALDADTEDFWNRMGFTVIQGYGLTECSPVLTANTEGRQKRQSVGVALPGVGIRIAEDGEVLAKGDNIFKGYYHDRQKTRAVFKDRWFCTGDIGELDSDGFLFIRGRKKDVIVTANGMNVYPDDIERVLNEIPCVKESCVFGLSSEQGEEVYAVIIPESKEERRRSTREKEKREEGKEEKEGKEGKTDIRKIVEQANARLDTGQRIMGYARWPEPAFPKTATLKIRKSIVKERMQQQAGKKAERKAGEAAHSKLALLLSQVSRLSPGQITPEKRLCTDLRIDSIGRVELVTLIEREYSFDFGEELIDDKTTVKQLENMIEKRKSMARKLKQPEWTQTRFMHGVRAFLLEAFSLPLFRTYCKMKVTGLQNLIQMTGPVIFAVNHQSYADYPSLLMALPRSIRHKTSVPARAEFFEAPRWHVLKRLWKRVCYQYTTIGLGAYLMPATHSFKQSLQYTGRLIDRGECVVVFPEGGHAKTERMLPFKPGIAVMVQQLKVPVVPVGIRGTRDAFSEKKPLPRRMPVTVSFGMPIEFRNEPVQEIITRLQEEVERLRKQ